MHARQSTLPRDSDEASLPSLCPCKARPLASTLHCPKRHVAPRSAHLVDFGEVAVGQGQGATHALDGLGNEAGHTAGRGTLDEVGHICRRAFRGGRADRAWRASPGSVSLQYFRSALQGSALVSPFLFPPEQAAPHPWRRQAHRCRKCRGRGWGSAHGACQSPAWREDG